MKPMTAKVQITEDDVATESMKSEWIHQAVRTIYGTECENIKVTFDIVLNLDLEHEHAMELIGRLLAELILVYDEDIYVYSKCKKDHIDNDVQPFNYYYKLDIGIMRAPYNKIT